MALQQLAGSNAQNNPNFPGNFIPSIQPLPPQLGLLGNPLGGGLATLPEGHLRPDFGISRPMPLPDYGLRPIHLPQPLMPDYSGQFEKFGEKLGGFSEQLTGYGDALGTFNEQVGGMGKQFETISNRLDSVDKGLGSLGNQIASLENMQKAQPQEVMQPQQPAFNPMYSPFGFGLGALFGRRY